MAQKSLVPLLPSQSSHNHIVRHYLHHYRDQLRDELHWFETRQTFADALIEAAHARGRNGKRLSHQRRLAKHVIPQAYKLLSAASDQLKNSSEFDELFGVIETVLAQVPNAGDLYSYDTALRVGAFLRIYPTRVFLQAGALIGARRILPAIGCRSISLNAFPVAFHVLAPYEMEHLLCCSKDDLHP